MFSPATTGPASSPDLTTLAEIRDRYDLPGPHATAVVQVPLPGRVSDGLGVRCSAVQSDLADIGASSEAIGHMDDLLQATHRRGHALLLTANDDSAACCWLGFDIGPSITIGRFPALLPALHQAELTRAPAIGAVIDRTGAALYRVGSFDTEQIARIEGDDERVPRSSAGGPSQARHQRDSEVIWERNAALIATKIASEADRLAASGVVLTGDDREVRLVEAQLDHTRIEPVLRVHAGARHEPRPSERLSDATFAFRTELQRQRLADALDGLRQGLGQQDRAVAGSVGVSKALTENRVATLFVDLSAREWAPEVDATVRAALSRGADLVTGHDFDVHDGIAAILQVPDS